MNNQVNNAGSGEPLVFIINELFLFHILNFIRKVLSTMKYEMLHALCIISAACMCELILLLMNMADLITVGCVIFFVMFYLLIKAQSKFVYLIICWRWGI
jgi:hypothetical protein